MTIEDLLRQAAAKGLTHLSLYPVPSIDGKTVYWNARATPSTAHSFVQHQDTDPVKALRVVLDNLPKAKTKTVTATVNVDTADVKQSDWIEAKEMNDWLIKS